MMKPFLSLFLLLLPPNGAPSFSFLPSGRILPSGWHQKQQRRFATVFYRSWDDQSSDIGGSSSFFDDDSSISLQPQHSTLAEKLSTEFIPSLARLAAVFNPQGQLDMRSIEHVEVLNVDDKHLYIEAIVCEEDGCVSVAVPVPFPHPCTVEEEDGLSECIMGNLDELDAQATHVIRQIEWEEEHHEEVAAAKRELLSLQSSNTQDLQFPDWWVKDSNKLLLESCDSIRRVLNEDDMKVDCICLATKSLSAYEMYDDWRVDQVAVVALCPTGLILRASAQKVQLFSDESDNAESPSTMMVEIPIPFREPADSAETLRANVLETVLAAADFQEEEDYKEVDDDSGISLQPQHSTLAEKLSTEFIPSLARLAAVFNPQGQLDMRSIEHVEVLNVDDKHLYIEAIVCEEDGCVSVAVPVPFPHPCSIEEEDGLSECVMGNLDELDAQATHVIRQIEWEEEHHEEVAAAKRELLSLQSSNTQDLQFPDWWVKDSNKLLLESCDSIRRVLNEDDMKADCICLASKSLSAFEMYDDWRADQVAVMALCPTGLILRASAQKVQLFSDKSNAESSSTMIVEIPIPFRERADSAEALRASVLETVLAAADFKEEVEEEHYEEVTASQRELSSLQDSNTQDLHFPDWWVNDSNKLLLESCDSICRALNDDEMKVDCVDLASKLLSAYAMYADWRVDQVAIMALCPTGLILRASARKVQLVAVESDAESPSTMMVEIPIPFRERANSAATVRANVLETVMAAAGFIDY